MPAVRVAAACVPGPLELHERRGQARRVPGERHGRRVGEVLAVAGHGRLDRPRGERREQLERTRERERHDREGDPHRDADEQLAQGIGVERRMLDHLEDRLEEHVGQDHDRADHQRHQQAVARVEVRHVGHLVGDDALELLAVELLEETAGDGDRGVGRVAPDGERVRRGGLDDVHLRRGQVRGRRHLGDDVAQDCASRPDVPAFDAFEMSRMNESPRRIANSVAPLVTKTEMAANTSPARTGWAKNSPTAAPMRNPVIARISNRTATSMIELTRLPAICW